MHVWLSSTEGAALDNTLKRFYYVRKRNGEKYKKNLNVLKGAYKVFLNLNERDTDSIEGPVFCNSNAVFKVEVANLK